MKVLVLGSGGREHALAEMAKKGKQVEKVFVAPGNAGTSQVGENVSLDPKDFDAVANYVENNGIDFVIVGPEDPLVLGIVDYFNEDKRTKNTAIFGPSKAAAQLEGSKSFAKDLMLKNGIPTAKYKTFSDSELSEAQAYLKEVGTPIVLKADGLAAGKGVRVCTELSEAQDALTDILQDKKYGSAGASVVIEEFLSGIELSVFAVCDGNDYRLLPTAKDYKRAGEGDTGLNTGGMGAISPVGFADESLIEKVKTKIVEPTLQACKKAGHPYKGFLYFGLMIVEGEPFVIEYNCRMGDPETQVVLPRITSDLLSIIYNAATEGFEKEDHIEVRDEVAAAIVLASAGYPGSYEKGKPIKKLGNMKGSNVYHAGTKLDGEMLKTNGGRVLAIVSFGENLREALDKSYLSATEIKFEGKYYRKDIGFDVL